MLKKYSIRVVLFCVLYASMLFGDDLQRLDTILKDIEQLRSEYETCTTELKREKKTNLNLRSADKKNHDFEKLLKEEKLKNKALTAEISNCSTINSQNITLLKEIKKLKIEIENYKKVSISKDKEIFSLKKVAIKLSEKPLLEAAIVEENNVFPKLKMKEKPFKTEPLQDENSTNFKADTYRLKDKATIYDAPNGSKIEEWDGNTSFTSMTKIGDWIKITGVFMDKKWLKADKDMWIKKKEAFKREAPSSKML